MNEIREILKNLVSVERIPFMPPQEIINEIVSNQYNEKNDQFRDPKIFSNLPQVIQDILWLVDLDTELSMDGILGFLENSSGLYLAETIAALQRIGAQEDAEVLKNISNILARYSIDTQTLRENVNKGNLYDITSFLKTHGDQYEAMADEIIAEAEKLYIYTPDRNVFDQLEGYIERNKSKLLNELG
jgi:hypothetical protein